MEEDADSEFLALSQRQRTAVDKAFNRGLPRSTRRRAPGRKAKSTTATSRGASFAPGDEDLGGGFVVEDEGGGFFPEDDGGGFIPDDEEGGGGFIADEGDGGGFITNDEDSKQPNAEEGHSTDRVSISKVSTLLASLGLPSDDDVLAVFQASAAGWDDGAEGGGGSVGLRDWRAVCAALMTPGDDEALQDDASADELNDDLSSLSSDEDDFMPSSEGEEEEEGSEFGKKSASATPAPKRRARRQPKTRLLPQQKELSEDIWSMLKPQGGSTLSKDEVKKWAREMGEMWSDDEITDMVSLFGDGANQLSFDQFCAILLRARLV